MHPEIASIKARLEACGASQQRLAEVSGVTSGHLSQLFSGTRGWCYVEPSTLAKLQQGIVLVEAEPVDPAKRAYNRCGGYVSIAAKKRIQAARRRRRQKGRKP